MAKIQRRNALLFLAGVFGVGAISPTVHGRAKCSGERFEIKRSGDQWYWTLFSSNGKKIADTEGYSSSAECKRAINRVKSAAMRADIVIKEDCE